MQTAPRVVVHMPEATYRPPPSLTDVIAATASPMRERELFMPMLAFTVNACFALQIGALVRRNAEQVGGGREVGPGM